MNINHLMTKRTKRGYILINTNNGKHTHVRSKKGCNLLKMFVRKQVVSHNPYLKESYYRIT